MASEREQLALAVLPQAAPCWRFADFELDVSARTLRRDGAEVPLRSKTWQLLCVFAANPHRLLTKARLMRVLWPRNIVVDDSLVQCVVELRRALGDGDRRLVRTVARDGYRFESDVRPSPPGLSPQDGESSCDNGMGAAWQALAQAQDLVQVAEARQLFDAGVGQSGLRAAAMAGVAMSHVIEVLNRWARCPAWSIALAREAAEESLALGPGSARDCHARAHVALLQGQHVDALLGFRAALASNRSMVRSRLRIAVIELELGHAERTFGHVREVLDASGDDEAVQAQAHFIEGMAHFHLGRDQAASACMQRTLALRPGSGLAHQWLASIDALANRPRSSASHLAAFCSHVPGHTIESLRSTERSRNVDFMRQRDRFYDGLRRAGLD